MQEPWYLKESVTDLAEVKAEFTKRKLKINQLPAVEVSPITEGSSRRVTRSGNEFDTERCNAIYDIIRESFRECKVPEANGNDDLSKNTNLNV